MGSYLALNGHDCGCKAYSHIIIESIRFLDSVYSSVHPNYFVPEERNKDGVGIGRWKLSRKGLATVQDYLRKIMFDENALKNIILDKYDYTLSTLSTQTEKDDFIKNHISETKKDVEECLFFIMDILTMSILDDRRTINLTWV